MNRLSNLYTNTHIVNVWFVMRTMENGKLVLVDEDFSVMLIGMALLMCQKWGMKFNRENVKPIIEYYADNYVSNEEVRNALDHLFIEMKGSGDEWERLVRDFA